MSEDGAFAPANPHKRKQDGQQEVEEQPQLCRQRVQRGSDTSTDTTFAEADDCPAYIGGASSRMPVDGWFQACRCQAAYARAAIDGSAPPWLRRVLGISNPQNSLARLEEAWASLSGEQQ